MRRLLGLTVLAFALGLGAVVGYRMSSEAMAVVVGVVCGGANPQIFTDCTDFTDNESALICEICVIRGSQHPHEPPHPDPDQAHGPSAVRGPLRAPLRQAQDTAAGVPAHCRGEPWRDTAVAAPVLASLRLPYPVACNIRMGEVGETEADSLLAPPWPQEEAQKRPNREEGEEHGQAADQEDDWIPVPGAQGDAHPEQEAVQAQVVECPCRPLVH